MPLVRVPIRKKQGTVHDLCPAWLFLFVQLQQDPDVFPVFFLLCFLQLPIGDQQLVDAALHILILPVLRQIVPSPEASVTRMTALLRQDDDYLTETARSLAGDTASLEREPLAALHPAILSRVLMILHSRTGADSSMSEIHIRQCMELICGNPSDASLDLPGNIRFTMDRHRISFVSADCEKAASPSFEIPFTGEDF